MNGWISTGLNGYRVTFLFKIVEMVFEWHHLIPLRQRHEVVSRDVYVEKVVCTAG
jgi:hypothetical protein